MQLSVVGGHLSPVTLYMAHRPLESKAAGGWCWTVEVEKSADIPNR